MARVRPPRGTSMTTRFRTPSAVTVALVFGLSLAVAGCGKYSLGSLKAQKAFKEANDAYKAQDWRKAAEKYEYAIQQDPNKVEAYFFLGNSYDNRYKPSRAGEPENDALMQKAVANYKIAAERDTSPQMKKLALQYLVAAYGQALLKAREIKPDDPVVHTTLAGFYNRLGEFDKTMESMHKAAELEPNNPQGYHLVATFYQEKLQKDHTITDAQKRDYSAKGIAAE